jgi:hypothetical protein
LSVVGQCVRTMCCYSTAVDLSPDGTFATPSQRLEVT